MSVRCWHVVLEWTKIMISEYWMWATWLTKVILYLSVAFVVGGAFCYFLLRQYLELKESILKYITIGAGLGLISSTLGFFHSDWWFCQYWYYRYGGPHVY